MAGSKDVRFVWDPGKSDATKRERGFGFDVVFQADWDYACLVEVQNHEGEERHLHIVPLNDRLLAIVTTDREDAIRVISVRMATNREASIWVEEFRND